MRIGVAAMVAVILHPTGAQAEVRDLLETLGASLSAGAGYVRYVHGDAGRRVGGGLGWDARSAIGTNTILTVEGAYVASDHALEGAEHTASLASHGLELSLRINLKVSDVFRPYLVGGAGLARYRLRDDMTTKDDITTFPVGAGLIIGRRREIFLDLRVVRRWTTEGDAFGTTGDFDAWNASIQVGFGR